MISTSFRRAGLALGFAVSLLAISNSASHAFSSEARQMCTGDAFRLCSSEIPNIPAVTACMRKNKANLSPGCRSVMNKDDAEARKTKLASTAQ